MSEIKRVLEVLEDVKRDQSEMKIDLAETRKDIKYHIRRTDILEEKNEKSYEAYLQMIGSLKFLAAVSLILGIIATLTQII